MIKKCYILLVTNKRTGENEVIEAFGKESSFLWQRFLSNVQGYCPEKERETVHDLIYLHAVNFFEGENYIVELKEVIVNFD